LPECHPFVKSVPVLKHSPNYLSNTRKNHSWTLLFVYANCAYLPEELHGVGREISIPFPWGSLLQSVVMPDLHVLHGFYRLCEAQAILRIVLGYNRQYESGITASLSLPPLTIKSLRSVAVPLYAQAGFAICARQMAHAELRDIPTTWVRRLAQRNERTFFELSGNIIR
jgi:hypothetical protein